MRCKAQSTAMPNGIASICNAAARPYRVDSADPISVIQWTRVGGMQLAQPGAIARPTVGELLRAWRAKRRLSQLEVGLTAGVSARHLSFIETGRARASAELLVALADVLDMPLRERNALLLAAGYAPRYSETQLDAPDMAAMQQAITRVLCAHDPYPGVALDRHWNIVVANKAAQRVLAIVAPELLAPPHNTFRLGLHPRGIAAHTSNFDEWGRHMLRELQRLADSAIDPEANALLEEVRGYPNVQALLATPPKTAPPYPLLVPCVLDIAGQRLSLFTTLATFGSPRDVTLAELTVELFYPADVATETALRAMA
jgi:transcriptional regulator with XRE-family HTH domain